MEESVTNFAQILIDVYLPEFLDNIWLYLSMPVISGLVGWGTNVLAIKMMFYPIDFVGIKPIFGWQGIVPRKSEKMARIAVDTITSKLISVDEMFERLDSDRIAEELEAHILNVQARVTEDIMQEHHPELWRMLPGPAKKTIIKRVQAQGPIIVRDLMDQIKGNIHEVFDLEDMVIKSLTRDRHLLNRVFLETGKPEFDFIGYSGLFFGFAFGLAQMLIWIFYKGAWVLPAFGLFVGWATNWVALKMIFLPRNPTNFGPITVQGLFLKRQKAVARDYGNLVADEILTPSNILESILKGPFSNNLFDMIEREVKRVVDETAGIAKPFLKFSIGGDNYQAIRESAVDQIMESMPDTLGMITEYAEDAMNIRSTLINRLQELPPDDFEGMLRPAFQEDEWMLIAVGAALGMAVGFFQLFVLFGDYLAQQLMNNAWLIQWFV